MDITDPDVTQTMRIPRAAEWHAAQPPPTQDGRPAIESWQEPLATWFDGFSARIGQGRLLLTVLVALALAFAVVMVVGRSTAGSGTNQIQVPDLQGKRLAQLSQLLSQANLAPGAVTTQPVDKPRAGTIVGQQPPAGQLAPKGSKVQVVVGVAP